MSVLDYASGDTDVSGSRLRAIGAAIYLGVSWTWCIGMFLPVLLIRDYGYWSWVVFAVPNVIGAAALGCVLSSESSVAIQRAHRAFVTFFSAVTAAFQIFFAIWIFHRVGLSIGFTVATLTITLLMLAVIRKSSISYIIAGVVFCISIGCWFIADRYGEMVQLITVREHLRALEAFPTSLMYFTPLMFAGFALCPYLDATFLASRAELKSPAVGRSVFIAGFGAVFLPMIVFTLIYAIVVWANLLAPGNDKTRSLGWVALHWCVQLAFTTAIHLRAIGQGKRSRGEKTLWITAASVGGVFLGSLTFAGFDGETIYRLFMGFYGLLFPAYVWLCMIPGRGRVAPNCRQLIVLGISVLVASPMFWMGFIERKMIWLLPGLAIVLLARLFIPTRSDYSPAAAL